MARATGPQCHTSTAMPVIQDRVWKMKTGGVAHLGLYTNRGTLSCATSSPVAFCAFSSPSGDNYILQTGLVYDGDRISKDGEEEGVCAVKITNIQEKDNGVWK